MTSRNREIIENLLKVGKCAIMRPYIYKKYYNSAEALSYIYGYLAVCEENEEDEVREDREVRYDREEILRIYRQYLAGKTPREIALYFYDGSAAADVERMLKNFAAGYNTYLRFLHLYDITPAQTKVLKNNGDIEKFKQFLCALKLSNYNMTYTLKELMTDPTAMDTDTFIKFTAENYCVSVEVNRTFNEFLKQTLMIAA